MDSMETRRNAIVDLINENGTVSFSQLKDAFPNVSEMTLRTDLKLLDEARRILRIHGGAKSVQVLIGTDDFLGRKSVRNIPQKQKIAEKALTLLRPDTTVYLDSGSTTTLFPPPPKGVCVFPESNFPDSIRHKEIVHIYSLPSAKKRWNPWKSGQALG